MANWRIPDVFGFSTLINFIKQVKKASDVNASDVALLQEDIQGLASRTAKTFEEVDMALAILDGGKLDKTGALAITIPATEWENSGNASYPKYYDIAVTGITASDRVEIMIAPDSMDTAGACGLCPTCQTLAGKIRVFSAAVPTADILAECWIEDGKE